MEVTKNINGEAEIKLGKYLDVSNAKEFRRLVFEQIKNGVDKVSLDFSEMEEIDSSGLGKLLFFNEVLKEKGGQFQVRNVVHKELQDLFKLIQIDKVVSTEYK